MTTISLNLPDLPTETVRAIAYGLNHIPPRMESKKIAAILSQMQACELELDSRGVDTVELRELIDGVSRCLVRA